MSVLGICWNDWYLCFSWYLKKVPVSKSSFLRPHYCLIHIPKCMYYLNYYAASLAKYSLLDGGCCEWVVLHQCPWSGCSMWWWQQGAVGKWQQLISLSGPHWSFGIRQKDCPHKEGHKEREDGEKAKVCVIRRERERGKWLLFWRQCLFLATLRVSPATRTYAQVPNAEGANPSDT